jgi:hypothetical protein
MKKVIRNCGIVGPSQSFKEDLENEFEEDLNI